jgi:glycerol uptake facilitator-like aquaporin
VTADARRRPAPRLVAEAIGTGLLLAAVVGSGIMAERLAGGNEAVALLANTAATAAALVALILAFGPVSGAHFNPAVTLSLAARGELAWGMVPGYLLAQLVGAVLGVWLAHAMFELPLLQGSARVRTGYGQWAGEFTATFALLSVVWGCLRHRPDATPFAVASVIAAAYWFTSSTSFANPAVTLARAFSDTFAGIRPADAPAFVLAQLLGAAAATGLFAWFARAAAGGGAAAAAVRRPLSGPPEAAPLGERG